MTVDLSEREGQLRSQGVPYARATVVRAQVPTSARPGDGAIILADGSIEGFVGGQCAESSVRASALGAMEDGEALLLRILPDGAPAFPDTPGAHVVVNPCLSGGSLEIFVQPNLPEPRIRLVGHSPIIQAMRELGDPLGVVIEADDESDPKGTDFARATAVVVASHGGDEAGPIRAALDAGVGFVGLVASVRRGAAVLDTLGLIDAERRRVHTPVGLDIGARTAPEIALSILAQIVQEIRTGGLEAGELTSEEPPRPAERVTDPVCGMTVVVGPDAPHLVVAGVDHWFCCPACRDLYAEKMEA